MKIHLHCVAWNDMPMLDFFFRHYDPFVTRYFIHDDGSTDGTLDYLARRSDVTVVQKQRSNPESYVESSMHVLENSWKGSRGAADWVIVTDIDEHLYHRDFGGYLAEQIDRGVTAIPALGFQMLTDRFPAPDAVLWRDHRVGAPWVQMNKMSLFRPDAIDEACFTPGRHKANPTGNVVYPAQDELLLLHYKYLGMDYVVEKHAAAQARKQKGDLSKGYGHRYAFDRAQLEADFDGFRARAIDYADMADPHRDHAEPRWWRRDRS